MSTFDPAARSLALFAREHHGLFRLSDAERLGVDRNTLARLVAGRWCDRVSRSVYGIAGAPLTPDQTLLGAVWSTGDDSVASHRAAARLWNLPGFGGAGAEVTRPRGQNQRLSWGTLHGSLHLPPAHVRVLDVIPVTTPARTVFDLAGVLPTGRAERALDAALQRKLCTLGQLQQVFYSLARRGRRGTATMRSLLEDRGVGYVPPASELERRARQLFAQGGLPEPAFEVDLGDAEWIGRVDCLWRAEWVVVELDGRRHHDGLSSRRADRVRDNRLTAEGWRVIRVTWDDIVERPDVVVRWIRSALAAAAA